MSRFTTFLKKKDLYLGITRYMFGLIMITYAVTKILKTQFVVIPFSLWQRPAEAMSGSMLAWAFLGYSPWFQVLLGFIELVPAILLLFRRTALIGAILLLPLTISVFLINHALHLWADTKVISLVLLLLNIAVLIFEWKRIKDILLIILGKGKKFKYNIAEIGLNTVAVVVVVFFFSQWLLDYMHQTNALTGDWYHQRPNEWNLQSEKVNDTLAKHRLMKTYYGAFGEYSEINDTGYVARNTFTYDMDEKKHRLKFYNAKNKLVKSYAYQFLNDSTLRVEKTDTPKNAKVVQLFKRRIIHVGAK